MKINYKNTALNLLDKWDEEINLPEDPFGWSEDKRKKFAGTILEKLPKTGQLFRQKIQYISMPFYEAYLKARHKLSTVFDKEDIEESGTWIWNSGSFTHTNFYYLKTFQENGEWIAEYMFLQFSKKAGNDWKSIDVFISGDCHYEDTFIWKGHYDKGFDHTYYLAFLVTFICFIKYCDIETKVVLPGKKVKNAANKYVNETKSKIEVLDSTWFTTIVKSDGFMVGDETGGFFRLQPYGEGLSKRRLTWIWPYEKEGYTRKAKVLGVREKENSVNQNKETI